MNHTELYALKDKYDVARVRDRARLRSDVYTRIQRFIKNLPDSDDATVMYWWLEVGYNLPDINHASLKRIIEHLIGKKLC